MAVVFRLVREVASGDVTAHSTKYSQLISNFTEATLNDVFHIH